MAEIGLAASIIAIIGAGVKLSIATFDFAASIGSAGRELQIVSTEISDLSAVFQHLQALLDHAHFRPSSAAVRDLQKIMNHCRGVFGEIEEIVVSLRRSKGNDVFPTVTPDFINKVKWTFKKSKVQMHRSSLGACKSTLSLMLNTLMLAESVSHSTKGANVVGEEQARAMTQTLVIAQQCAVEQLEHYEDEVEKEDETARRLPGSANTNRTNATHRRKSRSRLVGMFSGLSVITDLPTPTSTVSTPVPGRKERASLWLDSIVAPPDGSWEPHPGTRRQKRLSSAGTANAPLQLLQRWTEDSTVPQQEPSNRSRLSIDDQPSVTWHDSQFSFVDTDDAGDPNVGVSRTSTGMCSPKTARVQSISFCQTVHVQGAVEITAPDGLSCTLEDSHESVSTQILRDISAAMPQSKVELCVYYGGKTKLLKATERPSQLLRHYEDLDLEPRLVIRRKSP